jgi:8-oxo-dGTP diphosphatase
MHIGLKNPVPAVGAVIIKDGNILLVKRGSEPAKGKWSVPGGSVEFGETLEEALKREVVEETGLTVDIKKLAGIYNLIVKREGQIQFHYVLIDYFADVISGVPVAATDAVECRWVPLKEIGNYDVTQTVLVCLKKNKLIE